MSKKRLDKLISDMEEKRLEDYPFIEITVRAYNTLPDESGQGMLTFTTFPTEVYNGPRSKEIDNNGTPVNKIGDISGGLGFVVIASNIHNPYGGHFYFLISHKELWEAITSKLEQKGGENNDPAQVQSPATQE